MRTMWQVLWSLPAAVVWMALFAVVWIGWGPKAADTFIVKWNEFVDLGPFGLGDK